MKFLSIYKRILNESAESNRETELDDAIGYLKKIWGIKWKIEYYNPRAYEMGRKHDDWKDNWRNLAENQAMKLELLRPDEVEGVSDQQLQTTLIKKLTELYDTKFEEVREKFGLSEYQVKHKIEPKLYPLDYEKEYMEKNGKNKEQGV